MALAHNPSSLIYEHCIVQRLYRDVFIGDAERNYYVDAKSEINLCVHYTTRVPGKYEFIPSYDYYVTKGRKSLDLHRSIGCINNEFIIVKYTSLLEAEKSEYYHDFQAMKKQIDLEILRQIQLPTDSTEDNLPSCSFSNSSRRNPSILCECYCAETMEYVQLHCLTKELKLSISRLRISDLWQYLEDFYEIEPRELRLLTYLSFDEVIHDNTSPYQQLCFDMQGFLTNAIPPHELPEI